MEEDRMRRTSFVGLLLTAVLVSTTAPSFSETLAPAPDAPPPGGIGMSPMADRPNGAALRLAARLAAAEIYVGVTSTQLDVWRAYTSALIGLVGRPEFDRRTDAPQGAQPEGPPREQADGAASSEAPLFSERLAERVIERGAEANALKAASAALRWTLTPDQIARLRAAELGFFQPSHPEGPGSEGPDRLYGLHADMRPPLPPISGE
jgi:hypothetical protein